MDGSTHQTVGICSGLIVTTLLFPTLSDSMVWIHGGALVLGASLGSLMPDIDHPRSKMGHRAKFASKVVSKTCGHRGWTHTLLAFVLILSGLIYVATHLPIYEELFGYWASGFSLGYLTHLILDALTVQGIPLLKPMTSKNLKLTSIKSDSIPLNHLTQFGFMVVAGLMIYLQYFN